MGEVMLPRRAGGGGKWEKLAETEFSGRQDFQFEPVTLGKKYALLCIRIKGVFVQAPNNGSMYYNQRISFYASTVAAENLVGDFTALVAPEVASVDLCEVFDGKTANHLINGILVRKTLNDLLSNTDETSIKAEIYGAIPFPP